MTNQVSQGTLIERIGIDKSVITGFTLRNIDDVRSVLKELEHSPRKGNKKYTRFRKSLEYETDLVGNNEKAKEILEKVMNM